VLKDERALTFEAQSPARAQDGTWHNPPARGAGSDALDRVQRIDVDRLYPGRHQPRRAFDEAALRELAASIRAEGVLQPILVRAVAGAVPTHYEIIAGERRWRAAQRAGLQQIPVIVRVSDERSALVQALIENIQREDLNPVEEARGIERLIEELGLTHDEAATRLGRSRDAVTHLLRILKLAPEVLRQVEQGSLSLGHAKLLASQPVAWQRFLAGEVVHQGLSVRALERCIRSIDGDAPRATHPSSVRQDADIARLERRVSELVGAKTEVDYEPSKHNGRIAFRFHSLEQLQGLLERLGYEED
jgi:ParB family transcriptional regulator, chromosome partitioning protein